MSRGLVLVGAVLVGAVLTGCPKQKGPTDDPSVRAVRTQFGYIDTQVRVFAADNRRAPTPDEGLAILFDGVIPKDPWGKAIMYESPGPEGRAFDLLSYGSDGVPGGKKEAADLRWSEMH